MKKKSIKLVPFDSRYLQTTRAWANDSVLSLLMNRVMPITDEEHINWYLKLIADRSKVMFAIIKDGNEHIGNCWLSSINKDGRSRNAELTIIIGDADSRGKGLGSEACRQLLAFGFKQLNLHKIYLYIMAYNHAALRVYEKIGFTKEGIRREDVFINGSYHDTIWMSILEHEWRKRG